MAIKPENTDSPRYPSGSRQAASGNGVIAADGDRDLATGDCRGDSFGDLLAGGGNFGKELQSLPVESLQCVRGR
jgi:hypothetical protein